MKLSDLVSGPQHHFLWDGADLTVHLQDLLLLLHHADVEHSEVGPTQVQGQEVTLLCHQIQVITANHLEGRDDYNRIVTPPVPSGVARTKVGSILTGALWWECFPSPRVMSLLSR